MILTLLYILFFLILLFYFIYFFYNFANYKETNSIKDFLPAVSVVLCVRNEEQNIKKNLPLVLNQNYNNFEIIVVNDASKDNTQNILIEFSKRYKNLKVINLTEKKYKGKKYPLSVAVKNAKNEIILTIDADCYPNSREWIKLMAYKFYKKETDIVIGYSPVKKESGLLNLYQRFDAFWIALMYFSFALRGLPYMAVGRNLAFRKKIFSYKKLYPELASGDDDLLINYYANKKNIAIQIDKNSWTITKGKENFLQLWKQKIRHLQSSFYYSKKNIFSVGFFSMSYIFFIVLFLMLILRKDLFYLILLIFIIFFLIETFIFKKIIKNLGNKDILIYTTFLLIFREFITFMQWIHSYISFDKIKWK